MDNIQNTDRLRSVPLESDAISGLARNLHMFSLSSGFTINGGNFNNIGGDMNVYNTSPEDLQRVMVEARELIRQLRRLAGSPPPTVGHTNANALIITDALGERLTLPWSIASSFEELHNTMVKHFKHKIGENRVLRGDYRVARARGGKLVETYTWNDVMNTGAELLMIMLIDRIWVGESSEFCPKCGWTPIGTYADAGWLICRRCNTRFRCVDRNPEKINGKIPDEENEDAAFRHVEGRFRQFVSTFLSQEPVDQDNVHNLSESQIQLHIRNPVIYLNSAYTTVVLPDCQPAPDAHEPSKPRSRGLSWNSHAELNTSSRRGHPWGRRVPQKGRTWGKRVTSLTR